MGKLDGKVAFITGAGAGIGRASALLFAREGASVAIVEIDPVQGQETVDMILAQGSQAMLCQTDITDQQSVEQAVNAVLERFGQINILYNNAGGSTNLDDRVSDAPIDEFWKKIKLDLFGTWLCCRSVIPELIKAGGGSVINSTSVFALRGTSKKDAYTAAKGE
nr:SDR family NAD(P)-dependent oxidoreductase [Orrella marina]